MRRAILSEGFVQGPTPPWARLDPYSLHYRLSVFGSVNYVLKHLLWRLVRSSCTMTLKLCFDPATIMITRSPPVKTNCKRQQLRSLKSVTVQRSSKASLVLKNSSDWTLPSGVTDTKAVESLYLHELCDIDITTQEMDIIVGGPSVSCNIFRAMFCRNYASRSCRHQI